MSAPRLLTSFSEAVFAVVAAVGAVLGELDGRRSEAAGTGMDEHLLARLHVGAVDEGLPGGQGHQRHRGRLAEGE